jgi:hypothetical protein
VHRTVIYHTRLGGACAVALIAGALILLLTMPASAWAHGAIDPEASVDLARITHAPQGVQVRMVDGDLRLWMSAPRTTRITVFDYQGAPFLRYTPQGVWTNESSPMFYLNLNPPITPSITLTAHTPASWHLVTHAHSYEWHDGRIAALAENLSAPNARVLGHWTVPLRVDGRAATLGGILYHSPRPSLAWLWPAVVLLLILPALLRLRDPATERRVARAVAAVTVAAVFAASIGAGLHERPGLSGSLLGVMVVELALAGWAAWRLGRGRTDALTIAVVAVLALYRAIAGISVLWRGYVLLAIPATVGRIAISVCLAGGISLVVGLILVIDRLRPGAASRLRPRASDPAIR